MIAFVALHIYLDRAGTGRAQPNPELCQQPGSDAAAWAASQRQLVSAPRGARHRRYDGSPDHKEHPQPAPQVKVPSYQREGGGEASCPTVAAAAAWADGARRLRPTCRRLVAARVARRAAAASGAVSVGAARRAPPAGLLRFAGARRAFR